MENDEKGGFPEIINIGGEYYLHYSYAKKIKEENNHLRTVNAKLVEALEATLRHLLTFWRSGLPGSHNTNVSYAIEDVRDAIAKAKGE